jgi:hypothetical protein
MVDTDPKRPIQKWERNHQPSHFGFPIFRQTHGCGFFIWLKAVGFWEFIHNLMSSALVTLTED